MSKQIEEVMALVEEYGSSRETHYKGAEDELAAIEAKLRELLTAGQEDANEEIMKLRSALEKLKEAHNSDAASGGEMWYAETIYPAVELAIKALE